MKTRELTKGKARVLMEDLIENGLENFNSAGEDENLRHELLDRCGEVYSELGSNNRRRRDYYIDVQTGLYLYDVLQKQRWFSLRLAENDNFWRYLSIRVVPDIVNRRWGLEGKEERYWKKSARIWLKDVWFYIYFSWQGSLQKTEEILLSPNFDTDTEMNLVERSGKCGTYLSVYRTIMRQYSMLDESVLNQFHIEVRKIDKKLTLFRIIMKLNTAKILVIDPMLVPGGASQYVRGLFIEAGIKSEYL